MSGAVHPGRHDGLWAAVSRRNVLAGGAVPDPGSRHSVKWIVAVGVGVAEEVSEVHVSTVVVSDLRAAGVHCQRGQAVCGAFLINQCEDLVSVSVFG